MGLQRRRKALEKAPSARHLLGGRGVKCSQLQVVNRNARPAFVAAKLEGEGAARGKGGRKCQDPWQVLCHPGTRILSARNYSVKCCV